MDRFVEIFTHVTCGFPLKTKLLLHFQFHTFIFFMIFPNIIHALASAIKHKTVENIFCNYLYLGHNSLFFKSIFRPSSGTRSWKKRKWNKTFEWKLISFRRQFCVVRWRFSQFSFYKLSSKREITIQPCHLKSVTHIYSLAKKNVISFFFVQLLAMCVKHIFFIYNEAQKFFV